MIVHMYNKIVHACELSITVQPTTVIQLHAVCAALWSLEWSLGMMALKCYKWSSYLVFYTTFLLTTVILFRLQTFRITKLKYYLHKRNIFFLTIKQKTSFWALEDMLCKSVPKFQQMKFCLREPWNILPEELILLAPPLFQDDIQCQQPASWVHSG